MEQQLLHTHYNFKQGQTVHTSVSISGQKVASTIPAHQIVKFLQGIDVETMSHIIQELLSFLTMNETLHFL